MLSFASIISVVTAGLTAWGIADGDKIRHPDREGFIQVPGGNVWYQVRGVGTLGIPLLILHGGPGVPHDYLEPLTVLRDQRPVIFYDQLGCGNSERPDDITLWTVERFVEELACVRSALALDRVHLLGQSWGSMLAVDYMLRENPRGVTSLILSGPCLNATRFAADQQRYVEQMPASVKKTIVECEARGDFSSQAYQDAMMAYYRRHVCRLDPWPDCLNSSIEKMGQQVYHHMWGPSEFTVTGSLREYNRTADLKNLNVPTLFTCGRYDEATPEATSELHRNVPGSRLVILEEASHQHHLEQTRTYLQVVRQFLEEVENR